MLEVSKVKASEDNRQDKVLLLSLYLGFPYTFQVISSEVSYSNHNVLEQAT